MEHQEEAKLLKDLVNAGEWHLDDFEAYKNAKTTEDVDGKSCSVRFGNFEYTLYGIATKEDLKDMAEFGDNPSDITVQLDGHRPVGSDEEEAAIKAGNMEAYRNLQTRDMHLNVDYDGYENEDYTSRAVWVTFPANSRQNIDAFKQAFTERLLDNGEICFEDIPKYQELKDSHSSFYTARDFVENLNPDARITETEFQGEDYILLEDAYVCGQPSDPYYTALAIPFGVLPNEDNEVPSFQAKFEIKDPAVLAGDYSDESNACDWAHASDMEPNGYTIEVSDFMKNKHQNNKDRKYSDPIKDKSAKDYQVADWTLLRRMISLEALLRSVCKQKVADGKSPVAINKELKAAVKAVQKELSKANAR